MTDFIAVHIRSQPLREDRRARLKEGDRAARLEEVAGLFLKLGFIAFGGPAAHIALMRQEVVQRRKWLDEQAFLDLLGASNLIPGPTSTELAIYLGYGRAGPVGLLLAGLLFILPAMLMVTAFAWAYVQYGATPQASAVLYGIKPVILAVVVQAIYGLLRAAIKSWQLAAIPLLTIVGYFAGVNPVFLLFGLAIAVAVVVNRSRLQPPFSHAAFVLPPAGLDFAQNAPSGFSLGLLFLTFLKIGATLYGSGYVLLAFLHDDFVKGLGWLTDQQRLDAVAVGQFTPGPVFTTATFIGYILDGIPGALVATVAVFLPSFVLVAAVYPWVPRLRASPWTSGFLDGANAAAVGLMAAVAWQLAVASIIDSLTVALFVITVALLIRWKINSAWLVLAGGAVGLITSAARGS